MPSNLFLSTSLGSSIMIVNLTCDAASNKAKYFKFSSVNTNVQTPRRNSESCHYKINEHANSVPSGQRRPQNEATLLKWKKVDAVQKIKYQSELHTSPKVMSLFF
jgi:hypothetical protein